MLVLSLFPGIGLLDRAFEEAGFCVVRGPDVIWGGDIRQFSPPCGMWGGLIGGPPCQEFSTLGHLVRHNGYETTFGNLIPEYERVVAEAQPTWYVMENVRGAPLPCVDGYDRWAELVTDCHVGGVQPRERRISLGMREGLWPHAYSPFVLLEYRNAAPTCEVVTGRHEGRVPWKSIVGDSRQVPVAIGGSGKRKVSVLAGHGPAPGQRDAGAGSARMSIADMLEAQGMPRDHLDHCPFTADGKRRAVGNAVPMALGRAIAAMVGRVLEEVMQ